MKLAHSVSLTATFVALGLTLQTPARPSPALADTQPNVVVILTDDQDVDSLPVMRHLMSYPEGSWVQFSQAFTNVALCSPSRATLLTGQYAHHHTVASNHTTTFDDTNTLAVWLNDAGYETAIIGKYLNWEEASAQTPGWDRFYDTFTGGEAVDNYSNAGVTFIKDVKGPFFLFLSYPAPHTPAHPPQRYLTAEAYVPPLRPNFNEADTSDKPYPTNTYDLLDPVLMQKWQDERLDSQRELLAVDDGVRRVIDALSAKGVLEDTVIIFTADNGFSWGSHRHIGKNCAYEECGNFPLLIRYPGATNRVESRLVSNVDLAATICDYAAVTPGLTLDGRSLVPLLENSITSWPEVVLLERYHGASGKEGEAHSYVGLRTPGWTYTEHTTGEKELYDLAADPYQMDNVAGQAAYAGIEAGLAAQLPPLIAGRSVSGVVTTAEGQALAGAVVANGPGLIAITNADGMYRFGAMPDGNHMLTAARDGYRFDAVGPIAVPPGASEVNFAGEFVGYIISGMVTGPNGQPLAGVHISDGQGHEATTGSDGLYALPNLLPGEFALTPALEGYTFTPPSLAVTIAADDVALQNFAAAPLAYAVSGNVTLNGSPLAGVTVSTGDGHQSTTDAAGAYRLPALPPGTYTVTPLLAGYTFAPAARTVTVSDSDVGGQDFAATAQTYAISGVTTVNGKPRAGVVVADGRGHRAVSQIGGVYRLGGLTPGAYQLTPVWRGVKYRRLALTVVITDSDVAGQNFAIVKR